MALQCRLHVGTGHLARGSSLQVCSHPILLAVRDGSPCCEWRPARQRTAHEQHVCTCGGMLLASPCPVAPGQSAAARDGSLAACQALSPLRQRAVDCQLPTSGQSMLTAVGTHKLIPMQITVQNAQAAHSTHTPGNARPSIGSSPPGGHGPSGRLWAPREGCSTGQSASPVPRHASPGSCAAPEGSSGIAGGPPGGL